MSLKQPTSREYLILGVINVGVALYLATRGSWTAAYFVVIAIGAFWSTLRARPGR